jgi:hypothetical protein
MTITNDFLEELERLRAEAIPGPFAAEDVFVHGSQGCDEKSQCIAVWGHEEQGRKDAAYIAAACNAVPELTAEIRRLKAKDRAAVRRMAQQLSKAEGKLARVRDEVADAEGGMGLALRVLRRNLIAILDEPAGDGGG